MDRAISAFRTSAAHFDADGPAPERQRDVREHGAAVSEIEDCPRVRVLPVGAAAVAGHAGVDVAHLLADFTVAHMLGFYVVGRLAQRHRIKVQLRHSPYGGVTALVPLPMALLSRSEAEGGPEPVMRGRSRGLRGALPRRTPVAGGSRRAPPPDADGPPPLALEWREIAVLSQRPVALAELSARLRIPLGVSRVLVADMVAEGLLAVLDRRSGP